MLWEPLNECQTQKTSVEKYYWIQSKINQISQVEEFINDQVNHAKN